MLRPHSEHLPEYLEHLNARVRARQHKSTPRDEEEDLAVLPEGIASLCALNPHECLLLITETLREVNASELIQAVGDELLENLLNEHSAKVHAEVSKLLRSDQRFRQAFACGNYSSVDPALVADWVNVFQELGTTKQAERKRLWSPLSRGRL